MLADQRRCLADRCKAVLDGVIGTYTLAVGVPTKKPRANKPSFVIRLKHAGAFSGSYPSSKASSCTLRLKTPPSSLMECR